MRDAIYLRRRHRVNDICGHVITESVQGASFSAKLSHAMMHPLTRVPMLLALYVVIGQWVAGGVVGFLEVGVMQGYYEAELGWKLAHVFGAPGLSDWRVVRSRLGGPAKAPYSAPIARCSRL